jgi:hypothetical protein
MTFVKACKPTAAVRQEARENPPQTHALTPRSELKPAQLLQLRPILVLAKITP